ncbi:hypothetical protein JTE90_016039 [Oedothorax gibbosus]|uniref:EGF-like domain-containing protein n=1 Tax=Oedothorax gibbosus TaxID=931172 RepID=A0AAV6VT10_9ARAC|nr:hypothetical protein JTE90_016039 [Oedothorax gibbosus]
MYFHEVFCACLVFFSYTSALDFSSLPQINDIKDTLSSKTKPVSSCNACSILVTSFLKAVEETNRQSFQGGDAAWESEKLGRYENSELRFIEIQERLCSEVSSGKEQCYNLAERYEDKLEDWFYNKRKEIVDFFSYLCIKELKVCCPENTYGPKCLPCPGGKEKPCSGHGKCKNGGTRKAPAQCICDTGYSGKLCNLCENGFYQTDSSSSCEACDISCKSHCRGPGPKNCEVCADGYNFDESKGCILQLPSNSLEMTNDVTNETDEQTQGLEHKFENVTSATSQAEHSEL